MSDCVICHEPTTSAVVGTIGADTGPMCDDCQFWNDGNVDA